MRKGNFMKAIAAVFFTVSAAFMVGCVDQDNSELKQPKSPDDPIIAPAKLKLTPDLDIRTGEAELTLKADSGSFSDKSSIIIKFEANAKRSPLQISEPMLVKTYTYKAQVVSKLNNVTTSYAQDAEANESNTIQTLATTNEGIVLGTHAFGVIVDSARVTKYDNISNSTVGYPNAKAVYSVPSEITFYCHEYGTARTNNFKVPVTVSYVTWLAKDGIEKVGDPYAANIKRYIKEMSQDIVELDECQDWSNGTTTTTHFKDIKPLEVKTINLDDLYSSAFTPFDEKARVNEQGLGLTIGHESEFATEDSVFYEKHKTDIYAAKSSIAGSIENTVYMLTNYYREFRHNGIVVKFGYIQPKVSEIANSLREQSSDQNGYDLKLFENVIEVSYGVDSTGIAKERYSEQGKVYVKKETPKPTEVTVTDVKVDLGQDIKNDKETFTAKGKIYYSDNTTKDVDLSKVLDILYSVDSNWSISGSEATETTGAVNYKKTSSTDRSEKVENVDYNATWSWADEAYASEDEVSSNNQTRTNNTSMKAGNKMTLVIEGHKFEYTVREAKATTSNHHITKDSESGLTSTYYYSENCTWSWGGYDKELHTPGTITVTTADYIVDQHWYDIQEWDVVPTTFYHIGLYTEYASGKITKEEADLSVVNGVVVGERWNTTEENANDTSYSPVLTERSREDVTKSNWSYQVVLTDIYVENQLAGSKQFDRYVATTYDGVKVKIGEMEYTYPRRTVTATTSQSLRKVSDTEYEHSNVLTLTSASSSSSCVLSATAYGTINVPATVIPQEKEWGAYLGYKACAALSADGNSTIVGITARFEKGSLPIAVKADGTVDFDKSRFEPGSFIYDGATYTDGGLLVNCYTSKDDNFGLLWYRGTNDVQKMKSFTDLTRMDFNWKHNVFAPQKYGELVENNGTFSIPGTSWTWTY